MKTKSPLFRIDRLLVAFAILITLLVPQVFSQVTTNTWSTATSGAAWLSTGNWSPGSVPTATVVARFTNTTTTSVGINAGTTSTNNTAGFLFTGDGTVTISNSSGSTNANNQNAVLRIHGWVENSQTNLIVNTSTTGHLIITNGSPATTNATIGRLPIVLMTGGVINVSNSGARVSLMSEIRDSSGTTNTITKTGAGTLILGGTNANTWSGGLVLNAGVLQLNKSGALGAESGLGLTINGGSLDNGSGGAITLSNYAQTWGGNFSFIGTTNLNLGAGSVNLTGTRTVTVTANELTVGGAITNTGGITKAGAGTLILNGANTYSGTTTVNAGTLALGNVNALQNSLLDTGTSGSQIVTFTVGGNNTYNIGRLQGSDELAIGGNTLSVGAGGGSTTFSGVISGASGAFTKVGAGTVTLSGNNSYSGATTISTGLLAYNGTNTSTAVAINNGGTLGGSGSVGAVTVNSGGIIAPGNSPGTLSVSSLTLNGGGSYAWEMTNATGVAGTGWDVINVGSGSGVITLGATSGNQFTINVIGSSPSNFTASSSYTWDIIDAGSWSASFAANAFLINTNNFSATGTLGTWSVQDSSGNLRLVYTAPVAPPSSSTYVWDTTGGAWSVGGNWTNTTAPTNGSALIFAGASGGASTNDSQVNDITGLTFSNTAGSYTLSGSAFTNGASGIVNNSANAQTISNDITLGAAQSFNAASGDLTFAGAISNNANLLTVSGASNTVLSGVVSGSGGLTKAGNGSLTLGANNTFTGALAANGGTTLLNGTLDTTTVDVGGGTLLLGGNDKLADGATLTLSSGTLNFGGFTDTVTTFNVSGGVFTNGTATATTYGLSGGTIAGNLGTGTINVTGSTALNGTANAGTINVNSGTLTLGSASRLTGTTPAVTVSGGATLALGGAESVGSIAGAGAINLGAFTLTAGSANTSTTFSGAISGGGGLTKAGNATLTLTGTNTYTGTTTVSAGELSVSNNSSSVVDIASGATFSLNAAQTLTGITGLGTINMGTSGLTFSNPSGSNSTFAGVIAGTAALTKSGLGTLTLNGNNTFTGAINANAGVLSVDNDSDLGNSANDIVFGGGTLQTTLSFGMAAGRDISGTGTLDIASGTSLTNSGTVNMTSLTLANTGTFEMSGASKTLSGLTFSAASTLTNTGAAATIGGNVTASNTSGTVVMAGDYALGTSTARTFTVANGSADVDMQLTGSLTQSAANAYLVKAGTGRLEILGVNTGLNALQIGAAGGAAAGQVRIGNKDAVGTNTLRLNSGTLEASTALTGANAITNLLSIGGRAANAAIIGGANAIEFSGPVSWFGAASTASTLQVNNEAIFSGVISNGNANGVTFEFGGTGTMTLSGPSANLFTNALTISNTGLTVVAAKDGAFGTTAAGTTVQSGSTVILSNVAYSTAEALTINGTGVGGNGALRGSGTSSFAGAITAGANATIAADSGASLTLSGALNGGGNTVTAGGAGNVLLSGAVSNGNLSKTGAGTLTISNASSSFGTLTTGTGETAIATNATVTGLAGTDGLVLSGGTLTVNNGSGVTFNGALSGAGILAKTGAGTLTLGGANSYSGGTLVSTGELVGTTGSLQGSITNNAGVTFNQSADGTYAGNLTGTGVLTKAGAGTLTLTAANSQGVGTIISAGALQIGNGGTAGSLSGDIDNAGTLIFNRSDDIAYSGVVSGAGNLVKESAGTLTLSGANDYTGGTLVSGGALSGNTTGLQGAITNNAAVIFNQSAGGTYAGSLSGTGTLAKTGSGTLTMSGVNSFSGATTISAGQLVVNGTNANSAVTVSDSTTLSGTGQVGALTVSGTLAPGNSVGTLSAGSTIFDADGTFQLEMYDWTGSAGSGWDLLAITGDLTLNNTALNPFVIDLVSLSDGTNSGFSINFNANQNWTNTFVTYTGSQLGETFASSLFTVSTLNFSNALNGTFSITNVSGGLALLYTTSFDPGATYTWDVGSGVWSDGANWTNNAAPGNDSALQFTGAGGTATNDQVTSVAAITFADTTGSITLEGNAFALGVGGIENDSTNAHTIANNMSLATNVSIISASNNLTISGNITNDVAAQTLTIAGGNGVTISGAISGQGDVSKIGLGTVTLSGANTFTGALSVAAGEAVVDGTLATTTVGVTSGSLALGADNALANGTTLTVDGATATFTTVTFADTIGTLVLANGGTVAGTGVLTATTYTLSGGTVSGALGAGTANVDGEVSLTGTMASMTLNVNSGGTLTLGSADRIGGSTAVVLGGGTLALGANNDTVGSFSITSGSLTGTGTLTAATYSLGGGTLTANLGAGTATASSGTTALDGTLAGDLTVSGGTVNLGSSNRLGDSSTLTITSGTLGLGANTDTVSAFSISGGTLGGAGTLTASTYTLGGGTVSANLGGGTATATTGTTTVDGNLGGTLTASGGTVALNGTLADDLTVSGGTVNLGSANRLDDASTVNLSSGTLGMGANNDTVALFTISGGTLGGTGTLTAGSYALQGGTVSANLGTGTATASTGTTTIDGNLGGALTASGGTADLNGTVAGNVTVSGGTVNLGSNDRIGNSSSVSVSSGTLAMGTASDTVGTVQVTGGEISGSGTLTGSSYDVQAGTISTALGGSGELAKTGAGTATLSGNSSTYAGAVTVNDGTLLVANNNALGTGGISMSDGAVVANNGRTIANNFTIGTAGVTNASVNTFVAGWDFQTTTNGGTAIVVSPNTPKTILANFGDQAGTAAIYLNGSNGSFNFGTDQLSAFGGTGLNATNSFVDPSVTMSTTTSTGALAVINTGGTANGQRIVFSLDMDGLKDLQLSYASQRTATGFTTQTWSYSTDAVSWTNFYTNSTVATSFAVTNAPTLASLDNTGTVYIGLTLSGAASGSQNNRLDNILVNASTIGVTNASSGSGILGIEEAGSATFSGAVTNNNAATFTAASGGLATFSGTVSGNGSVTKTGTGTVTLSGNNSYSGGTTLNEGILRLDSATAAGTGSITQTNTNSTLEINTTGTVANQMSIFNVRTLQTVTLSGNKTLNNATYTVDAGTTTTESGVLSGSGGITKEGTGSLVVTASNSFTGATLVNAGTLNLNSSTGSALGASTNVTVAATLLISQSGQVADNAAITLSGGTISRASGVSETFGALSLTDASFLDFGSGTSGNLTFGAYEDNGAPSALLTVNNFFGGNTLVFGSNLSSYIDASYNGTAFTSEFFNINSTSGGFTSNWNGSTFTITAIPEPSTYLAAAGLLSLMLWPSRKRLLKDAKKILGLRAPMRDRLAAKRA